MRVTRGVAVGATVAVIALVVGGVLLSRRAAPRHTVIVAAADAPPTSFHVSGDYDGPSHFTVGSERCDQIDTVWDATVSVSNGETWKYHNEYCGTLDNGLFNGAGPFSFTVPNGDRLLGTRHVANAPIPGTGGSNELRITGGTGQYTGATGACVMHNHHEEFAGGNQRQWGSFECDITAPSRAAPAEGSGLIHVDGDYDGISDFAIATERCAMVDTVWDATFAVSNGETWQYHNGYCGTVVDGVFNGAGSFSFTVPNGDTLTGTTATIDVPVPAPSGAGGPTYLSVTGGTGGYADASGACVLDNHVHNNFEGRFGHQRQWGTFECDITVPALATPPTDATSTTSTTEPVSTTTETTASTSTATPDESSSSTEASSSSTEIDPTTTSAADSSS